MVALVLRQASAAGLALKTPLRLGTGRRRVAVQYRGRDDGGRDEKGSVVLYTATDPVNGGLCPYSQAVIMALLEKKIPFREVKVDLSKKPVDFKELYHSIIPDRDVRERVPVLVNGTNRLVDSTIIVEYLAAAYPDSGTPLSPLDPYTAARVKLFVQYFTDHVVPAYHQLVKASDPAINTSAKQALMKALASVDEFLALHGAGEGDYAVGPHYGWSMSQLGDEQDTLLGERPHEHYLMGPFYSTAEVLSTPFVARMVEVLPEWRDMDVLAECDARKLYRVAGWMRACMARPSAQLTGPNRKELVDGLVEWEWSHAI
jgi:glutathione S-transferase